MGTISELFLLLERFLSESVNEGAARLADEIAGPVVSCAVLYILMLGTAVITGNIPMPLQEFLKRILLISFVSAIALEVSFYQREIVPSILAMPDGLAAAILPGNAGPIATVVDSAMTTTAETMNLLLEKAGIFSSDGLAYAAAAILFALAAVALLGVGSCLVIVSKSFLAILLVLGPAAIACLMFERTSTIFDGWVRQLANYIVLSALVATVFGTVAGMYDSFAAAIIVGNVDIGKALIALMTGSVIGTLLMLQLPHLSSGIAGGVAIQISRPVAQMMAAARGAVYTASSAGKAMSYHSNQKTVTSRGVGQNMPKHQNSANATQPTTRALAAPPLLALPAPPKPAATVAMPVATAKTGSKIGIRYQAGSSTGTPGRSPGIRWKTYKPKSGGKT